MSCPGSCWAFSVISVYESVVKLIRTLQNDHFTDVIKLEFPVEGTEEFSEQ